jgi:hypothetical protein
MTKKQYSKPQLIQMGDAIKATLAADVLNRREIIFNRGRVFF